MIVRYPTKSYHCWVFSVYIFYLCTVMLFGSMTYFGHHFYRFLCIIGCGWCNLHLFYRYGTNIFYCVRLCCGSSTTCGKVWAIVLCVCVMGYIISSLDIY